MSLNSEFKNYTFVPTESKPFPWSGTDEHYEQCRRSGNPVGHFFDPSYEFEEYKKNNHLISPKNFDKLQDKIEKAMLFDHNFVNDNHRWWGKHCCDHGKDMEEQQRLHQKEKEEHQKDMEEQQRLHQKEKEQLVEALNKLISGILSSH
jgi:hypothetical protein